MWTATDTSLLVRARTGNPGDRVVIGNTTPRYEYGFRLGADWKGVDFSIFFQGIGQRKIWGKGQLAIPGYHAKDGGLPKTFTKDYWTEENTDAFYPRAWNLGGADSGFGMQVQSKYLLNMAYLRIKNITLGYSVPTKVLSKAEDKQGKGICFPRKLLHLRPPQRTAYRP